MQNSNPKPLCFEIEGDKFSYENRIDVPFFHPKFMEADLKIHSSIFPIYKFDDLIEFMTDGKHGGWNFVEEGVLFIRNTNVKEDSFDLENVKYISEEDHNTIPRAHLREGDVLFTTIGTIGVSAVVNEEISGANINQNLVRIILNEELILPEYFSIFLNSNLGRLQSERYATGSIQKIINYPTIKKFVIPIPPLKIQKEIVDKLNEAKKFRHIQLKEVKKLKHDLYKYFLKGLNLTYFDNLNDEMIFATDLDDRLDPYYYHPQYNQLISNLENSKFKTQKIKTLVEFNSKQIDPKKEPNKEFIYIQIQDIDPKRNKICSYTKIKGKEAPSRARRAIKKNDILLPTLKGSSKSIAIVPEEMDNSLASTGFAVLSIKNENMRYFIFYYLTTIFAQLQIKREFTGSIMPSISIKNLKNMQIPTPDETTLKRFAEQLNKTYMEISKLELSGKKEVLKAKEEIEKIIIGETYARDI